MPIFASASRRPRSFASRPSAPLFLVSGALCLAIAAALVRVPFLAGIGLVAGIIIFIVILVNAEASIYVLICSMLLSPEFMVGGLGGASETTASRGVTLRSEDLLLVVLVFAWLVRMAVHKDLGLVRDTPLNRPIGSYVTACLLATGLGMVFGYVNGMTGFFFVLKYVEYFVIYFVAANYTYQRSQVKRYTIVLLLTALVVAVVAMLQIPSGGRVSAPFEGETGEPNTLGGYLLFVGTVATALAMALPQSHHRWLLAGLVVTLLVPFLFTLSRASYLGLPVVYVMLVMLWGKRRVVMIGALVVVGLLGALLSPDVVKERVLYTFQQESASHYDQARIGAIKLDTSTTARLRSWEKVLEDIPRSPIWGFGVTGYGFLDAQYPRILVETGILGLVVFFALIRAVYKVCWRVFRTATDPLYRGLALGTLAGLAGLLVHAVGSNTFIIVRIMEPFWLVVGLVVSISKMEKAA